MNQSNFVHCFWALAFQSLIGLITGNWWAGAAFAIGYFWSREVAQRQYHLSYGRSIKLLDPWEGWDLNNWSKDALLDAVCPTVAVLVFALFAEVL